MNEGTVDLRVEDLIREREVVIMRRVERLERENVQLRRQGRITLIGAALLLALSTGMLISASRQPNRVAEVIESKRFVLRDDNGHVRGVLALAPDGGTRFVLQDRDGRERLKLTLLSDGSPGVAFTDREGRSRAVLGVLPDETATLVFADRSGKTRAVLGLSPDESSTLVFADRTGETRVGLGVDTDGAAGLTYFEPGNGGEPAVAPREAAPEPAPGAGP